MEFFIFLGGLFLIVATLVLAIGLPMLLVVWLGDKVSNK